MDSYCISSEETIDHACFCLTTMHSHSQSEIYDCTRLAAGHASKMAQDLLLPSWNIEQLVTYSYN